MTERYGFGHGDEGQRPSGRGAVTERLARQPSDAQDIDLTDEAAAGDDTAADPAAERDGDQTDRESSSAFEPAPPASPAADPPAEATRPGSSSIFDVDERARQEDLNRTGYEPPLAETDGPEESRAETPEITPTPVPAPDPPAGGTGPAGQPEAPSVTADEVEAPADAPAATADAPAAAGEPGSLLGSLDAAGIRNRFLDIQAGFVDEPRQAVEEAGRFVDDLLGQVADALRQQRGQLAGAGPEGSTEDLRLALRAYRQFVDRLLGVAN
jgi:hypothetical protein